MAGKLKTMEEVFDQEREEAIAAGLVEVAVTHPIELVDDDICNAIKEDDLPDTVFKAVLTGYAEEQNSLKTLRESKARDGKDYSHISSRRGQLLRYLTDTMLERQKFVGSTDIIDLRGPRFREIFRMLLEIIAQTFDEVKIPVEFREVFFHALSRNLEGWEERAERKIKGMK